MTKKVFHGNFTPDNLAALILLHFNRGNLEVQKIGSGEQVAIQIRTRSTAQSGGQTAIGVTLQTFDDGVIISTGQQQWAGIAASLGYSALAALRNPFTLLGRIDDIAQDLEYLSLEEEIWNVLSANIKIKGSQYDLSRRLQRMVCDYCDTANPVDAPACIACGAPMGDKQPKTCKSCGYVLTTRDRFCPNCRKAV
jgi:RNA polymerase subunit RPABC4/transcription elongation factor Spt4